MVGELALYPQEKWGEHALGKSENIHGNNLILHEIYQEIEEARWLKETTTFLFCRTERIRQLTKAGAAISEFAYIPVPGLKNAQRIKHPCEFEGRGKAQRVLTEAPGHRSRELAWIIPYKTTTGDKTLIFIFTFDPLLEVMVRTVNLEWEKCTKYWRDAIQNQGLLKPGESASCIHAFTGLHEWMNILDTGDGEDTPPSWKRHRIEPTETAHAANCGLDIYYSNNIVAYAWSTLEKQKGRERARMLLQQNICKRVILFDPIYGKIHGIKSDKKEDNLNFLLPGDTEREKTAKSFWDSTISTAYESGASDIHIEPMQVVGKSGCDLIVSLRKDAQLNFHTKIPSDLAADFARFALETSGIIREENRRPQDGRRGWVHPITKEALDLRISVTPVGAPIQKIVMRLLDTNKLKRGITDIGLEPEEIRIWERALALNQSLVLVAGPTNSGKTLQGDTPISTPSGPTPLRHLVSAVQHGEVPIVNTLQGPKPITRGYTCGEKPEWELLTSTQKILGAITHPFLTNCGWLPIGELKPGHILFNGDTKTQEEVISAKPTGKSIEMFDIEVAEAHHYFASHLVCHNSTTLYAALLTIFQRDNRRSFATIEDPVEYRLPFRATQSPVSEEKGASYERLIRQAMRNDGDTFLIGEIRDTATAAAALQLSLTGHQVLSSIHANSATETALRLLEFGVDPYILAETVKLVVAQKLIPTACPLCKKTIADNEIASILRKNGGELLLETFGPLWAKKYRQKPAWIQGEGCPQCQFTGLSGLTAAQEFLIIDKKNKKHLKEGNIEKLEESMKERSLLSMEETIWKFAWLGRIPISQAGELTNQLKSS